MDNYQKLNLFFEYGKKSFLDLISKMKNLGMHYRFYLFGIAILIIFPIPLKDYPLVISVLYSIASLSLAAGFLAWCWPFISSVWARDIGKLGLGILNFFVFLVATAFSRYFVARSLQLPPQDFDLTVSFCMFFLYVPCLALVLAIITGITAFCILMLGFFKLALPNKQDIKFFMHFAGALMFGSFCAQTFDFANGHVNSVVPAIRFIAWIADFQPTPVYPGVGADERIRLLENGVVAVADLKKFDVTISLREM